MPQKIPLYYALPAIVLSTLLVTAIIWGAWTEPTSAPPGDNVPAPINVGAIDQVKTAGISVGSFISRGGAVLARDAGNVGIGIPVPGTKLDVAGTVRMTGFQLGASTTAGYVLTANGAGVGTWQAPPGGGGSGLWTDGGTYIYPNNVGTGFQISDGGNIVLPEDATVDGVDISDYSDFFIDTPGVSGQVWKSDGSGRGVWGTDETGAGGSWICTDHDGTGLGCSGDELYLNDDYYWGAEARCPDDEFLDGDGSCRDPFQIVSDGGGGGGGSYSWDLYEDGTNRDTIVSGEDVGFDSGTGINVSWDGSRDIGFSLVDATKGCGVGEAIRSFDLSGTANPTCVAAGGISNVTFRRCYTSGTTAQTWTCTVNCLAGTYRTGCSGQYDIPNDGYFMNSWSVQPSGANGCTCFFDRAVGAQNPSVSAYCWAYCAQ